MLSKEQIKAAIFENRLPTKTIKPFKKIEWDISLRIVISPFPNTLEESIKLLATALVFPNKSQKEKEMFLKSMSLFVINILFKKYKEFYDEWVESSNKLIKDIVKNDNRSKFVWEISKHVGVDKVLRLSEYNDSQLLWIFFNLMEEKRDKNEYVNELIKDVFEMLKPWLDKDLYAHMKEAEESKRENVLFDEQTQNYLEDTGDKVEVEYS